MPGIFGVKPPQWFGPAPPKEIAKSITPEKPATEIATTKAAPNDDLGVEEPEPAPETTPETTPELTPEPAPEITPEPASKPEVTQTAKIEKAPESMPLPRMVEKRFDSDKTEKPAVKASKTQSEADSEDKIAMRSPMVEPRKVPDLAPMTVARVFLKRIPSAHLDLLTPEQKASFINFTLPLILAANEEILQRRAAIKRATDTNDRAALEKWAQLYKVNPQEQSDADLSRKILQRADVIPVALAMSQAAIESGWGTSRFAQQGNALFGQWAWDESAGLKPLEASNERAVVRSFPNLFGSVRAYMHNLNVHPRYDEFRQERAALAHKKMPGKAYLLAFYLDGYAEIGFEYVEKLRAVMRVNDLDRFALAKLQ